MKRLVIGQRATRHRWSVLPWAVLTALGAAGALLSEWGGPETPVDTVKADRLPDAAPGLIGLASPPRLDDRNDSPDKDTQDRAVVQVADALTREPVVGALVHLAVLEPWQHGLFRMAWMSPLATTDAQGRAEILLSDRAASPSAVLSLSCEHVGYCASVQRFFQLPTPPEHWSIQLQRGETISGLARTSSGSPARGAVLLAFRADSAALPADVVDISATEPVARAVVGPDGQFELRVQEPARYRIEADAAAGYELFSASRAGADPTPGTLSIAAPQRTVLLTMDAVCLLRVRCTDAASGEALQVVPHLQVLDDVDRWSAWRGLRDTLVVRGRRVARSSWEVDGTTMLVWLVTSGTVAEATSRVHVRVGAAGFHDAETDVSIQRPGSLVDGSALVDQIPLTRLPRHAVGRIIAHERWRPPETPPAERASLSLSLDLGQNATRHYLVAGQPLEAGVWAFPDLPVGRHLVRFFGISGLNQQIVDVSEGRDTVLESQRPPDLGYLTIRFVEAPQREVLDVDYVGLSSQDPRVQPPIRRLLPDSATRFMIGRDGMRRPAIPDALPPGRYSITATKKGYMNVTAPLAISAGEHLKLEVPMMRDATSGK